MLHEMFENNEQLLLAKENCLCDCYMKCLKE